MWTKSFKSQNIHIQPERGCKVLNGTNIFEKRGSQKYFLFMNVLNLNLYFWKKHSYKYFFIKTNILIHYVCNAHFHWLWRRKFAALKSLRLCHESSDDVTSLATRRSNVTKTFWKSVLSDWIRMVITRFVIEWFADINCIILRSQIPVLPLRWRVAVKLNLRP